MNKSEIEKFHKSIATDFKIVTRKTDFWDMNFCHDILHDLKRFMLFGYLESVSLVLNGHSGLPSKAKKYFVIISERSVDDRPGSIDWEGEDGSGLNVVLTHTAAYKNLSYEERTTFHASHLKAPWSPTNVDPNFPGLRQIVAKTYSHEGRGINRVDFN